MVKGLTGRVFCALWTATCDNDPVWASSGVGGFTGKACKHTGRSAVTVDWPSLDHRNRPVRIPMRGGVVRAGENPAFTRLYRFPPTVRSAYSWPSNSLFQSSTTVIADVSPTSSHRAIPVVILRYYIILIVAAPRCLPVECRD